jgi:hypothetical protein
MNNINLNIIVRFEVFTAVAMKIAVLWDVTPCRSCVNRRFGGMYHNHLQGRKILERGTSVSRWLCRDSDWLRAGPPRGWSSSPGRGKVVILSAPSRPVLEPTQFHIQWVSGALSPGVKRPKRETDNLPPSSAEVRVLTPTPPYVFMA